MIIQMFNLGSLWLPPLLSAALSALVAILLVFAFVRIVLFFLDVILKIKDIVMFWR